MLVYAEGTAGKAGEAGSRWHDAVLLSADAGA